MEFIPHYVRQKSDLTYGDKVTHENYNEKLNRNTRQGDYNTDILFALFHNEDPTQTVHIPYIDNILTDHEDRITTLENTVDTAVDNIADIISGEQVVGRAEYADNITDAFDVGPNKYYGTNASGIPGFIRVPDFIYADPMSGSVSVDGIYFIPGLNSVAETMLTQEVRDKLNREGITDYSYLTGKPKINNVELSGNKSLSDLGIQPVGTYATPTDITTALTNYYTKTQTDTAITNGLNGYATQSWVSNNYATSNANTLRARISVDGWDNTIMGGSPRLGDLIVYTDQNIYNS